MLIDADRKLKQIRAIAKANVPNDEQVSLHAHLMRDATLERAKQKFGLAFALNNLAMREWNTSSDKCGQRTPITNCRWTRDTHHKYGALEAKQTWC